MISFGPVPSRRLGKSLGINNIPSRKICTYSCIYCQLGITGKYSTDRDVFYDPAVVYAEAKKHLACLNEKDLPDFLTFVSNGEPTLDKNLGKSINLVKSLKFPVAVITNASLLNDPAVRDDLMLADWVSVKIDCADETTWKRINRPSGKINFEGYLKGLHDFSKAYQGTLVSETMLVQGINDNLNMLQQTAQLAASTKPSVAYISIPTRPPAAHWVKAPDEEAINMAFQVFNAENLHTELILGFEGVDTGFTGNAIEDITNICTVHPIRKDVMMELLKKDQADPITLNLLLKSNYIKQVQYNNNTFYIRHFSR